MSDILNYYGLRASEYEQVYEKPERQGDLARLARRVRAATTGRRVLEVACGTGYWTERYAASALSVLGVDASPEVIAVAERKSYPAKRASFAHADAYALESSRAVESSAPFTAAVAAFWWSHVPRAQLATFLRSLHACLSPGSVVWFCDNLYVEGSSTPISHADDAGNTYQRRRLNDGSEHVVLKNFPADSELHDAVAGVGSEVQVQRLDYFWAMQYTLSPIT